MKNCVNFKAYYHILKIIALSLSY